ncbi:MAG: serine/threonine protein kinase [Silvanigrellales bacterium]|nr:serine/threonine protein kinase [Silvanigrellales bacterium]
MKNPFPHKRWFPVLKSLVSVALLSGALVIASPGHAIDLDDYLKFFPADQEMLVSTGQVWRSINWQTNYEVKEFIGAGGVGRVFKVSKAAPSGSEATPYAFKELSGVKQPYAYKGFMAIKNFCYSGCSDVFLRVEDIGKFENEGRQVTSIVMQYASANAKVLFSQTRLDVSGSKLSVGEKLDALLGIYARIGGGLKELGRKSLSHNDIKPENFLLVEGNKLVIGDFDAVVNNTVGRTVFSTPAYSSPEFLKSFKANEGWKPNETSDLFSLGVAIKEFALSQGLKADVNTFSSAVESAVGNAIVAEGLGPNSKEAQELRAKATRLIDLVKNLLDDAPEKRRIANDLPDSHFQLKALNKAIEAAKGSRNPHNQ